MCRREAKLPLAECRGTRSDKAVPPNVRYSSRPFTIARQRDLFRSREGTTTERDSEIESGCACAAGVAFHRSLSSSSANNASSALSTVVALSCLCGGPEREGWRGKGRRSLTALPLPTERGRERERKIWEPKLWQACQTRRKGEKAKLQLVI